MLGAFCHQIHFSLYPFDTKLIFVYRGMTTPVGGSRHTGVSSKRYKGSKLAVYGIFLMMSLVWYTNTFFLPIFASLVVWERTSFVSALISFIIFQLSEYLSCSCSLKTINLC